MSRIFAKYVGELNSASASAAAAAAASSSSKAQFDYDDDIVRNLMRGEGDGSKRKIFD